jgi:NAD(P)-dependent dehydrogenase (short-subunit alcohol dehydrogenase family)
LAVCDLGRFSEVRALALQLSDDYPKVDLLVNNAGVYLARKELTEDGFERTFAVNHLAHFLLTQLLLGSLLEARGRVVNVSSDGHRGAKLTLADMEDRIRGEGRFSGMQAYCDSKLANVLFTKELSRRYPASELSAVALHPGVLATRIWNKNLDPLSLFMLTFKLFMRRPRVGGQAVASLAGLSSDEVHGEYFHVRKRADPAPGANDPELAGRLWELSSEFTGVGGG